jgi:hypothetical protein
MNHMRFVRRTPRVLLAFCSSLVTFTLLASSAFARPSTDGASTAASPSRPSGARAVVSGGMDLWQIALIAVGAALFAATVAVLIVRTRSVNRRPRVSAA